MTPIFAAPSRAAQSHPALTGVKDPSNVHETKVKEAKTKEAETKEAQKFAKPEKDEYLPEEKHESSGRYWMEQGEDGQKKIHFDDPDKNPKANNPEKTPQKPEPEICRGNNDKAVREIEKLKEEKKTLEQQIQTETDEEKIKKLEQKLAQVENELRQKDNNGYLRRNTVFS